MFLMSMGYLCYSVRTHYTYFYYVESFIFLQMPICIVGARVLFQFSVWYDVSVICSGGNPFCLPAQDTCVAGLVSSAAPGKP
jgi:prolipoprotein diacylglyceryltransferase